MPVLVNDMEELRFHENFSESFTKNMETTHSAVPYPHHFTWSINGVAQLNNDSGRIFGYPNITFNGFLRSYSGRYTLSATNYPTQGSGTGGFDLDVLCENFDASSS